MKKNVFVVFFIFCGALLGKASDLPVYSIFNQSGKPVTFKKMVTELQKNDVILFGEYHDDPIMHWLQVRLTRELHDRETRKLILGAEMFEADMQDDLDRYLKGEIDEKTFKKEIRSLWPNYATDYKPLVEFAKEKSLPFIATNIPRFLASSVYKYGFESLDTLPESLKSLLPPLPMPYDASLPGYKAMLEMMGGHGGPNLPKAQASKDATMAHHIVRAIKMYQEASLFIHYNGTYHSDNFEGIQWYLKQYEPSLKVGSISAVRQADVKKLEKENMGKAHFTICVIEDITRTH